MEESHNRNYVNISNRPFEHRVYEKEEKVYFSYKPIDAFWLSLESKKPGFQSEWDEEYGEIYKPDENGNLYATTVKLKPTTYVMNPEQDKTLLEGFFAFVKDKEKNGKLLTNMQRRQLLVEMVKKHKGMQYDYVVCQIDLLEDIDAIEEIFGGYKYNEENSDEIYEKLELNVINAFKKNFSGVEVTGYALGLEDDLAYVSVQEELQIRQAQNPKYKGTLDYFEIHSMAVFDTKCLDVIREIEYPHQVPGDNSIIVDDYERE